MQTAMEVFFILGFFLLIICLFGLKQWGKNDLSNHRKLFLCFFFLFPGWTLKAEMKT